MRVRWMQGFAVLVVLVLLLSFLAGCGTTPSAFRSFSRDSSA
ncbi:MAG: hypothetical protein ACUVTO_05795 [Candidatus Caldatribacteriaceae bacterium]